MLAHRYPRQSVEQSRSYRSRRCRPAPDGPVVCRGAALWVLGSLLLVPIASPNVLASPKTVCTITVMLALLGVFLDVDIPGGVSGASNGLRAAVCKQLFFCHHATGRKPERHLRRPRVPDTAGALSPRHPGDNEALSACIDKPRRFDAGDALERTGRPSVSTATSSLCLHRLS